jgi:hypothetical protein
VARAVPGGNEFFGFRVETDFTDVDAFWRAVLLSIGAGPESFAHLRIVRRLAGCYLVADPRIWPLKITRVVSSYGNVIASLCAGNVFLENARVGPLAAQGAAAFLEEIVEFFDDGSDDPLAKELGRRRAKGDRFPGYGVAFRPHDERVVVTDGVVREEGCDSGRHWRCSKAIESILAKERSLPRNVVCATSAVLLDCGFSPHQIGLLIWYSVVPTFVANAVEGAAQRPEVLRSLPLSAVEYVGPGSRVSPARASANAECGKSRE